MGACPGLAGGEVTGHTDYKKEQGRIQRPAPVFAGSQQQQSLFLELPQPQPQLLFPHIPPPQQQHSRMMIRMIHRQPQSFPLFHIVLSPRLPV